jgi:hypothetical protein
MALATANAVGCPTLAAAPHGAASASDAAIARGSGNVQLARDADLDNH